MMVGTFLVKPLIYHHLTEQANIDDATANSFPRNIKIKRGNSAEMPGLTSSNRNYQENQECPESSFLFWFALLSQGKLFYAGLSS